MLFEYDIIVVGGGHAGCEAAAAAATMGCQTLLVTMDMTKFAQMSCNPAVGGVAKGQIVREIDALGGRMGIITDRSTIQFRMLNRSKGPAMWSPRAQCDKMRFSELWRETLENIPNLYLWQDSVNELLVADGHARGIKTRMGVEFNAKAVILTAGTFLGGLMHIGRSQAEGGRAGDAASHGLSEQLAALGFEVGRMKTGTPARLDARTIDFRANSHTSLKQKQLTSKNPVFSCTRLKKCTICCGAVLPTHHSSMERSKESVHDIARASKINSAPFRKKTSTNYSSNRKANIRTNIT